MVILLQKCSLKIIVKGNKAAKSITTLFSFLNKIKRLLKFFLLNET